MMFHDWANRTETEWQSQSLLEVSRYSLSAQATLWWCLHAASSWQETPKNGP